MKKHYERMLMKPFNKKFKIRIRHYTRGHYTVDYAYYCFLKRWINIEEFIDNGCEFPSLSDYNPVLFSSPEKAINFANKFKSIEDMKKHDMHEIVKYKNWLDNREKWLNKHIPFRTKCLSD